MHTTATRSTRRPFVRAATVATAALALVVAAVPPPASAAVDEACATPQVRETMVSQGLPTYGPLVRGKSTLLKLFLSTPSGCDPRLQHLTVSGGTLTVRNSATASVQTLSLPVESHGPITPYTSAPSTSSTGNPTFLVKGDQLGPVGDGLPYTVDFRATITYTVTDSSGSTPVTSGPRSLTAQATGTVNTSTHPMRLLVVPIGDEVRAYDDNFPPAARDLVASAMQTLGRLLPVSDGVGRLSDTSAGVRYDVALSDSLVDVGPHDHDFDPSTAEVSWLDGPAGLSTSRYCPSPLHFPYVSAKLAAAREAWNRANPNAPASRVLGVLWQGISRGASTDDETATADGNCVEGYATVPGTVTWSRVVDPHPGNVAQSSGSIAAMELMHTLGAVPNALSGYHSQSSQADGTAVDRAYDLLRRSHIALDKSVMRYFYDAWHDDITLLEPTDWTQAACVLSANRAESLTGTACSEPATVGAVASAAADRVHLAGKTDGTAAGTHAHTYVATGRSIDATDPASPYQLVYHGANGELSRTGVRVSFDESGHKETSGEPGNGTERSPVGVFDAAVVPPAGTVEFALVKKGTPDVVLYGRSSDQRPVITAFTAADGGAPVRYAEGPEGDPFPVAAETTLSEDGTLIAWETPDGVAVRRTGDLTSTPLSLPGAKDPSFAHGSAGMVYATLDGSEVRAVELSTASAVPTLSGPARVVYASPRDVFGTPTAPVEQPAFSPDDDRVVLASEGWESAQLYVLDAGGTCTLLGAPGCAQLTTAGHAHDPSWGRSANPANLDGIIAFTDDTPYDGGSSSAVAVINPAVPALAESTRLIVEDDAAGPDWGGTRLAYWAIATTEGAESVAVTVDGTTYADRRTITPTIGGLALSGDDLLLAYSAEEVRPLGEPSRSAIYLKSLGSVAGERVVRASDDAPSELRLDVLARCAGATHPLLTDVAPTTTSSGSAGFQVHVETDQLCPGAVLQYDVTDGFQLAEPELEPVSAGGTQAAVGVVSPRTGDSFLQHRSVPLAINGRDASGAPAVVSYTLTGPGGTNRQGTITSGDRTDLAPLTVPGSYTLTASLAGTSSSSTFTVLEDRDADGVPASIDSRGANPCLPADPDLDARTAVVDYDGDFLVGVDDVTPCVSAHNATVDLDANTLRSGSSGTKLTVYVTAAGLSGFTAADVRISRLAGHHVSLPALSWAVDSSGRGVAKFDRQRFASIAAQLGLTGFVPTLVEGRTGSAWFSGIDPNDPTLT